MGSGSDRGLGTIRCSLVNMGEAQVDEKKMKILPMQLKHIYVLSELPAHHKNPFDRLLTEPCQLTTHRYSFSHN